PAALPPRHGMATDVAVQCPPGAHEVGVDDLLDRRDVGDDRTGPALQRLEDEARRDVRGCGDDDDTRVHLAGDPAGTEVPREGHGGLGLVREADVHVHRTQRQADARADQAGADDVHLGEALTGLPGVRARGHRPAALYSLPISSRERPRHRPDLVPPSSIGPTWVRTRLTTGWPTSSSSRRTMCLRPSCRMISTMALPGRESTTRKESTAAGPSSSSTPSRSRLPR